MLRLQLITCSLQLATCSAPAVTCSMSLFVYCLALVLIYSYIPAGAVQDVKLAGASTDQMALVEFSSPLEAAKALNLNGMKIGDTHTLQVSRCSLCGLL